MYTIVARDGSRLPRLVSGMYNKVGGRHHNEVSSFEIIKGLSIEQMVVGLALRITNISRTFRIGVFGPQTGSCDFRDASNLLGLSHKTTSLAHLPTVEIFATFHNCAASLSFITTIHSHPGAGFTSSGGYAWANPMTTEGGCSALSFRAGLGMLATILSGDSTGSLPLAFGVILIAEFLAL